MQDNYGPQPEEQEQNPPEGAYSGIHFDQPAPEQQNHYRTGVLAVVIGLIFVVTGGILIVQRVSDDDNPSSQEANTTSLEATSETAAEQEPLNPNDNQEENTNQQVTPQTELPTTQQAPSYPANVNPLELDLTANDTIRRGFMETIGLDMLVVSAKTGFDFPTTLAGIEALNEIDDPHIDPETGQLYEFVLTEPGVGQMQFVPGGSCMNSYRNPEYNVGEPRKFYALVLRLDDGSFICHSNTFSS